MGAQTSSVTAAIFLSPWMSGCRSTEQTSAIAISSFFFAVPHELQIIHGGFHVDVLQHAIAAVAVNHPAHLTLGIVHVPENNGLRGTRLLAGGLNISVGHRVPQSPCLDLALLNALHAEGALLHHTA